MLIPNDCIVRKLLITRVVCSSHLLPVWYVLAATEHVPDAQVPASARRRHLPLWQPDARTHRCQPQETKSLTFLYTLLFLHQECQYY